MAEKRKMNARLEWGGRGSMKNRILLCNGIGVARILDVDRSTWYPIMGHGLGASLIGGKRGFKNLETARRAVNRRFGLKE